MHSLESAKNTIKDHPTETVAAVAVVAIFGIFLVNRNKTKKMQKRINHCTCSPQLSVWKQIMLSWFMKTPAQQYAIH